MRFTDGPQPDPLPSASAVQGRTIFSNVGCALCHTPQMQTAPTLNSPVLQNRPAERISYDPAVGDRTTHILPSWRTDRWPSSGNPSPRFARLGSQCRRKQVQRVNGVPKAGHSGLSTLTL